MDNKYVRYFSIGEQCSEGEFGLRGAKVSGDISKSTRVTQDFIKMKVKMTLTAIGTVVCYLEKDQERLRDVTITGLADAVRWVDRLLGAFTLSTNMMKHRIYGSCLN